MREYTEITGKLWELIRAYEVSVSDTFKTNVQGMIEGLYWCVNENVDDELRVKIENII